MGNVPSTEEQLQQQQQQQQQGQQSLSPRQQPGQSGNSPQYETSPKELSQKHQKNRAQLNQSDLGLSSSTRERRSGYKGPRQMSVAEQIFFSELMQDDIFDDYDTVKFQVEEKLKRGRDLSPSRTDKEYYETLESDSDPEPDDESKFHSLRKTGSKKLKKRKSGGVEVSGYASDDDSDEESSPRNPHGELTFELDFRNPGSQKVYSKALKTGNITWRVSAIPLGPKNTHLSLFVEIIGILDYKPGRPIRTRFTLYLKNRIDPTNTQLHQCEHDFVAPGEDWGFQDFAPLSEITRPSNGFLSEKGTLTICATLEHLPDLTNEMLPDEYDSRDSTGYVGLRTQSAGFYVNSLIQALYHTSALTQAVFGIQTEQKTKKSSKDAKTENTIVAALQDLFFNMRFARKSPTVQPLIHSFGWEREDSLIQHDVQEFDRTLLENIAGKTTGTPLEGTIKKLFCGTEHRSIRCTNVDYEKANDNDFYDITIDVRESHSLEEFFTKYTKTETLDGSNKYATEEFGLQVAEKSCHFVSFPPVLHIQLKRWVFDHSTDTQVKVNDRFEFPTKIDLTSYLGPSATQGDEPCIYKLHSVLVHSGAAQGGNYYSFIRPTLRGKWFKFKDECVSQASLSQIIESSYGGESEYFINAAGEKTSTGEKYSSACKKSNIILIYFK